MSDRREFSKLQKGQMIRRASDEKGRIWCEGCGLNVTGKRIEFDHIIPEAMRTGADKKKPISIAEGQLLGRDCCHRAPGGKTAQDLGNLGEAKRREAAHYGFDESPYRGRLKGAGFRKAPPQRRASSYRRDA